MADGGKVEFETDDSKEDRSSWQTDSESYEYENKKEKENFEIEEMSQLNSAYAAEYSSVARKSTNGTISQNILKLFHSYAYNCQKYFNLCVADMNTIIFASGNLIHFLDVVANKVQFRIGSMGNGIGHICKNPVFEHIAVGENGTDPPIIIYNWPTMKIVTVLKGGTTKRYFHLTYSPDGLLLVSQGGEPDYCISLWNWKESKIILQCKSYVQDVYNITFSKYIPGQLTSSGLGHIKFWKMSKTFTGLKLKSEAGKFGNTEISDIIAIHPMPNETVISGCEWGNILLWDESLIKLEACRKNKQMAHDGYISQFEFINGELISVGSDGWIRFWFYETIDHADLTDEEHFLEIQPIYEFHITEGDEHSKKNAMLMTIKKQEPDDPEKTMWYAQDGNGGLWLLDLCTSKKQQPQKKIFICHAGPITDMDTAVWGPFVATLDRSGHLHVYNYIEKKLIVVYTFDNIGSQVIWLPCEEATLLIGCLEGDCVEVQLPTVPQSYTTTSYELAKCKPVTFKFESVKSSIQREIVKKQYEQEREEKIKEKKKEIEQLKAENPHIIIDEEAFLLDIDDENVVLPDIYIPEIPNRVLVVQYNTNGDIWLFMAGFDMGYIYEYPRPLSGKIKNNKPVRSRLMENAKDTEIHCCLFFKNRKYLFLGTQYGEIYICKIKEKDPLDFSDHWILPIHDYYNGQISKMSLSYDKKMLLTCGHDGNIFSFEINDDSPHENIEIPKPQHPSPLPANVEDIEDADYPSLEEVITRMEQNRVMSAAEKKKREVLRIVHTLAEEYVKITNRNKSLPPAQQISHFELDPRIVVDLKHQLNVQAALIQEKLAFDIEKSTLELQKLKDHFVTPITCLPFAVCGILNENRAVSSLRELKLNTDSISKNLHVMKTLESLHKTEMQEEMEEQEREEEQEQEEEEGEEEMEYLESFLVENYSDLSSGIGLQINQMLSKYKEKKRKLIQRKKEWQILHTKKPNLAKSRADDAAFLKETKKTLGECNLKMGTGFNLTKKKETAISKYEQLLQCRNKLHQLREGFNTKLKAVRTEKQRLQKEIVKLVEILKGIHKEIPLKSIKPLPLLPKLNFDIEFPEYHLELEKYTSMSERVEQVKRQRQSLIVDQTVDSFDLEYEVLLCDDKIYFKEDIDSLSTLVSSSKIKIKDHLHMQSDVMRNLIVSDSIQTSWEREMKRSRMWRKIYEQDCILKYIDNSYKQLEKELDELEDLRLDVIYQSTYMNLHLLTLYEEFIVLRECEVAEHTLEENVQQTLNERVTVMLKMETTNIKITTQEDDIRKLQTRIKEITAEFAKAVADNKFNNFLQKVFKKKYTAAHEQNSLDSLTQSSETSSDETESIVDSETEHIPFDENICPPGCDKESYEMAFSMRDKRYAQEFQIKELQREIELLHKELETDTKSLRVIENNLRSNRENLETFMLEKQRKLNNIDVTVVLKIHQLQHLSDSECTTEIQDCVIFNKKELSDLYTRIGELQQETHDLEDRRKKSEIHLKRIKKDLKYMESQNKKLQDEVKEKTIQKFGRRVSIINLYETVLQRLIYDTKTDVRSIMKNFAKEMKDVKRNCNKGLKVLENLILNNTEKLSFLTVLEKEKFKLKKFLKQVPISKENMLQLELEYKNDIEMLESILRNQMQQKQLLQYDIENLKIRPGKLPSICLKENVL